MIEETKAGDYLGGGVESVQTTVSKRLGKRPPLGDSRTLQLRRFLRAVGRLPKQSKYWDKRRPFPARSYGNIELGDCTRASQAHAATRMQRIEGGTRKTITIPDEEVRRVYFEMTGELYPPGGDTGAYELDALNAFRRPDKTFKDDQGHPITIDAFTAVTPTDFDEIKAAIHLSASHGIKLCMGLPLAFSRLDPPQPWDVPPNTPLTGDWEMYSWGGHSMYADAYLEDNTGFYLRWVRTWDDGPPETLDTQLISGKALANFADEMYLLIDSVSDWLHPKGREASARKKLKVLDLIGEVNKVSSHKIVA